MEAGVVDPNGRDQVVRALVVASHAAVLALLGGMLWPLLLAAFLGRR
jgi:hypothetical protein